jgi:hypothetical protein
MNRPFAAMFRRARSTVIQNRPQSLIRRQFSAKAIYSSFPAILHYYPPRPTSSLFDYRETNERPHGLSKEAVAVEPSGLVYPAFKGSGWYLVLLASMEHNAEHLSLEWRRHVPKYFHDARAHSHVLRQHA